MSKHTPGPWKLQTVLTQIGHCHKIGEFPGSSGKPISYACVYVDGPFIPGQENGNDMELFANARLMAAAPDLLAACEFAAKYAAMQDQKGNPLPGQLVAAIANAIARAKGGT